MRRPQAYPPPVERPGLERGAGSVRSLKAPAPGLMFRRYSAPPAAATVMPLAGGCP
jgi:hypothetical protein